MIELYGMASPNVRKVVILLEELDLSYDLRHVEVFREAQFDPQFRRLNPLSKVPVLIDRDGLGVDRPIFESGAILIYLAETHRRFLPAAGTARYDIIQWLIAQMAQVGPMLGQHNHFLSMADKAPAYAAARYREQARRLYVALDGHLASREWLAAGQYSIADMATYPWATYCEGRHGFSWSDFPALKIWHDRIMAREPVRLADAAMDRLGAVDKVAREAATSGQLDRFYGRVPG